MIDTSKISSYRQNGMTNLEILSSLSDSDQDFKKKVSSHIFDNPSLEDWEKEKAAEYYLDKKLGAEKTVSTIDRESTNYIKPQIENPFNPFRKGDTTFSERLSELLPKKGSLLDTVLDYGGAPARVAVGYGTKALSTITGQDVSQIPEVRDLPQNIEKAGDTLRLAIPVGVGIGTTGASVPVQLGASFLAGAGSQAIEDLSDRSVGDFSKNQSDIAQSAFGAGIFDATADALTMGVFKLAKAGLARKTFDDIISEGIDKGIKPLKQNIGESIESFSQYKKRAGDAFSDIISSKGSLKYIDDAGEEYSSSHVPTTLNELSQAISQGKKRIFDTYSSLSEQATKQGVKVDLNKIAEKLLDYADNTVKQLSDRNKTNYAKSKAVEFIRKGILSPKQTEELIADLNASLANSLSNKTFKGVSEVDASIANALREELDNVVLSSTGEQYQTLKNLYGAYKTIEKDVAHRALIEARKNTKGLLDMTDIFTGGDALEGLLTGNPAKFAKGAFGKGLSMYYKFLNTPDSNIMRMFSRGEKALGSLPTNSFTQGSKIADDIISPNVVSKTTSMQQSPTALSTTDDLSSVGKSVGEEIQPSQSTLPQETSPVKGVERVMDRMDKKLGMVDAELQKKFPNLTPEEIASLTPEEKSLGVVGGSDSVGGINSTQKISGIPDELQGLAQEAKKYKSAEEFIKEFTNPKTHFQILPKSYLKNPKSLYRGVSETGQGLESKGFGSAVEGKGLYTTTRKEVAKGYAKEFKNGVVKEMDPTTDIPKNPLYFRDTNAVDDWITISAKKLGMSKQDFNSKIGINKFVNSLGHDGVAFDMNGGVTYVKYFDQPITDLWNKAHSPSK